MVALTCPKCKSTRLKRSHTRNFFERMVKVFNRREYRCIDCGWRGTLHLKSSRGFEAKPYTFGQIVLVVVVIILAVLVLIYWLGREPNSPSEASAKAQELIESRIATHNQPLSHVVDSRWVLESLRHCV